jgi:hypothetical protein
MGATATMDFTCTTNDYFFSDDMPQFCGLSEDIESIGIGSSFQQATIVLKRVLSNIGGVYKVGCKASADAVDFFPERSIYGSAMRAIYDLCQRPSSYSERTPDLPNEKQAMAAKFGLMKLATNNLPEPKIMLLDEGTLGAFWYASSNRYVSIDFEVDGTLVWGVDDENGIEVGEFSVAGDIPDRILSAF